MRTVTATKARQALGELLGRALKGEDIGIVHSETGEIVALRPVKVYSEDHALLEYGVTEEEVERAYRNTVKRIDKERKAGTLKRIA